MGCKSSKRSDNGQQVCEKKSTIVNVTIENESERTITVFDAEAEAGVKASNVNDKVDDALWREEVEACRQPHVILAHSTITLQREVGASFRFWTEKGLMAFAFFADDLEKKKIRRKEDENSMPSRMPHSDMVSNQTLVNKRTFHAPCLSKEKESCNLLAIRSRHH